MQRQSTAHAVITVHVLGVRKEESIENVGSNRRPTMPAGRPTKLTPEIQDAIVKQLANGSYLETACASVGISRVSMLNWLRRGARSKKGIYREFLSAVRAAQADAESRDVDVIDRAAKGYDVVRTKEVIGPDGETISATTERSREFSWQAAAWRLERKYPKRWGRRQQLEHTGKNGSPMTVNHQHLLAGRIVVDQLPLDVRRQLLEHVRQEKDAASGSAG